MNRRERRERLMSHQELRQAMQDLQDLGLIKQLPDGSYTLTEYGLKAEFVVDDNGEVWAVE